MGRDDSHRVLGVTARAERPDLLHGEHDIRRCDCIFIQAVGLRSAVALSTTYIGLSVDRRQCLFFQVHMTRKAKAVIGNEAGGGLEFHCGNQFLALRVGLGGSRFFNESGFLNRAILQRLIDRFRISFDGLLTAG